MLDGQSARNIRVLFLVDEITQSGGVRTRVTEELGCVTGEEDIQSIVVSRCNIRSIFDIPRAMTYLSADLGVQKIRGFAYPKIPHGGLPVLTELSFILNLAFSVIFLLPLAAMSRVTLVYAHNNEVGLAGILLSRLLGIACIVDLHGVEIDENFEKHPEWSQTGLRKRFWRAIEGCVATKSDAIACVSSKHKDILEGYRGGPGAVHVVPCFANENVFRFRANERETIRKQLAISDDEILFVHSGIFRFSTDGYDAINLFRQLSRVSSRKLLVLAPDRDTQRRAREFIGTPIGNQIVVVSCPRKDVTKYLSAADVAILVRKDTIVNRVASPTKFAEYLLCGLPVLVSHNIGDSSDIIKENGLGVVLGDDWVRDPGVLPSEERIRSLVTPETRQSCREFAEIRLSRNSWARTFTGLIRLYSK